MKHTNNSNHKDLVTLREYLESKLEAQEKALNLARDLLNVRLEGMNEFRADLQRLEGSFLTRMQFDAMMTKYDLEIKSLNKSRDETKGKADSFLVYIGWVLAIIAIILKFIK